MTTQTTLGSALLGLAMVAISPPSAAAEPNVAHPIRTIETLLTTQPSKWDAIHLVRETNGSEVTAYRWEIHSGDRDRRGQGAFTRTIECLLNAPVETVKINDETEALLDIMFTWDSSGKKSKLYLLAKRKGDKTNVTLSGSGELYDEFIARLDKVQAVSDAPSEHGLDWNYEISAPDR